MFQLGLAAHARPEAIRFRGSAVVVERNIGASSKPRFTNWAAVYPRCLDTVYELAISRAVSRLHSGPAAAFCLEHRHVYILRFKSKLINWESADVRNLESALDSSSKSALTCRDM
jgi:hypothetical protein